MAGIRYIIIAGAGFLGGILYRDKAGHTLSAARSLSPANVDVPAAMDIDERGDHVIETMKFGFPSYESIRSRKSYVISYDRRNRVPNWVLERLTPNHIAYNENVSRSKTEFFEDDSIHPYFRSTNSDYRGSGYDRGHLAAAGNHRSFQEFLDDTFVLSNIAPQVGKGFNRDIWNKLEKYVRGLVKKYRQVYVCSGPLYLPRNEADGKKYVKYEVIGANNVAVPTHFFKIILCETESNEYDLEAYVLPNTVIDENVPLKAFLVPRDSIERAAGFLLFEKLPLTSLRNVNGLPALKK
ncbi:endonuclease G, mitochondrial-like [Uloborus diversus]|uniref:endonuclease G, mitochondrial-like n=1 Tax=Uloborus diversus TaxID=327109 RepID=UPI002409FFC4|nr:endonuclease G, mitochondrial-like [Uloborus diversus]